MIELRGYQQKGADDVLAFFRNGGKHVLVQGPTGSGKTIIFSYIAQGAVKKHKRVLILTNRHELLMQTGGALSQFGLQPFYIQSGAKFINYNCTVYVAMIMTLSKRLGLAMWRNWILNNIDLIIIDEAHIQDFNAIFENGVLKDKFVVGFTATPRRTGKMRQLALDYEDIISTVTVPELIEMGYLVADDYFGVAGANLNNIKYDHAKGDYSISDMFSRFNSPKLYAGVVKNWLEIAKNTHTLVFGVNIEHVIHICEEFRKNDVDARFIVSKMSRPKEPEKIANKGTWVRYEERMRLYELYKNHFGKWSGERSDIVTRFNRKQFPVLINASILTTGYDCPAIETIIVNRATTSLTLWLQMIGRGARIWPGKTHFNLLDFGENANRLGHYTSLQGWGLWHEGRSEGGIPPVKECGIDNKGRPVRSDKKGCMRLILASYTICPFCGFIYPKKQITEVILQTLAYNAKEFKAVAVKKISEMDTEELYEYFKIKKHKSPWLWRQLYFRGGIELISEFGAEKGWRKGTIDTAVNYVNGLE